MKRARVALKAGDTFEYVMACVSVLYTVFCVRNEPYPFSTSRLVLCAWCYPSAIDEPPTNESYREVCEYYTPANDVESWMRLALHEYQREPAIAKRVASRAAHALLRLGGGSSLVPPRPQLADGLDATLVARACNFSRHPRLLLSSLHEWSESDLAGHIRAADDAAYSDALEAVSDLRDMLLVPDSSAARVLMKELLAYVDILGDSVRSKLKKNVTRTNNGAAVDDARDYVNISEPVILSNNLLTIFELLLRACGFQKNSNLFAPLVPQAVHALFGHSCSLAGLNWLRRLWFFNHRDLVHYNVSAAPADQVGLSLANPLVATDEELYRFGPAELSAAAQRQSGVLPAWTMRNLLEDARAQEGARTSRVQAMATVHHDGYNSIFDIIIKDNIARGPPGSKSSIRRGGVVTIRYTWQLYTRDQVSQPFAPRFRCLLPDSP